MHCSAGPHCGRGRASTGGGPQPNPIPPSPTRTHTRTPPTRTHTHLHVAGGHLGEVDQPPGDAHELRRDFGAHRGRQVGCDAIHLALHQRQDAALVRLQLQHQGAALLHLAAAGGGGEGVGWVGGRGTGSRGCEVHPGCPETQHCCTPVCLSAAAADPFTSANHLLPAAATQKQQQPARPRSPSPSPSLPHSLTAARRGSAPCRWWWWR